MRTSFFSQNHLWTLGLLVLSGVLPKVTLLGRNRDRRFDRRGGGGDRSMPGVIPTSFLVAVRDDNFAKTLKLTKEQDDQLRKLREESFGLGRRQLSGAEMAQAMKELDDKGLALLDDDQKAICRKSRKLEIIAAAAKSEDGPSRSDLGSSSSAGGVIRAETAPACRSAGAIPDEKPPEGEIAVISFGALAPAKANDVEDQPDAVDPDTRSRVLRAQNQKRTQADV